MEMIQILLFVPGGTLVFSGIDRIEAMVHFQKNYKSVVTSA